MKVNKKIIISLFMILVICTNVVFGATNHEYGGDRNSIDITESTIANNLVLDYVGQFIFSLGNIFQSVTEGIMNVLTGDKVFPWADKVIFNTVPLLDVNFINPDPASFFSTSEDSIGIGVIIRNIYFTGLSISLGFMGIIIAILAIRLAISSIGSEKAKYKEAIMTWATSLVLLFGMHYFIAFMFYMNEELVLVGSKILGNTLKESGEELSDAINKSLNESREDLINNFIDKATKNGESIGSKYESLLRDNAEITYLLISNPTIKANTLTLVSGNDQASNKKTGFFDIGGNIWKAGNNVAIGIDSLVSKVSGNLSVSAQEAILIAKGVEAIKTAMRSREVETSEELFDTFMETYDGMSHDELVWQVQNNFIGEYEATDEEIDRVNARESETNPYPDYWLDYIASQGITVPDYNSMSDSELYSLLEQSERKSIERLQNDSVKVYENTVRELESSLGPDNFCTIVYKYALQAVKGELNLGAGKGEILSNLGEYFKQSAWTIDEENGGWSPTKVSVVSAILYTIFVFQSISFFVSYLKRLFMVVVLAVLAPFVVIYDFFKKSTFGANKGGIINSWLRELGTLIFVQTFHAILLAIIMSIIVKAISSSYAKGTEGALDAVGLLAIFALLSLPKLELLVKNIFGLTSGVSDTSLAGGQRSLTAGGMLAMNMGRKLLDNPRKIAHGLRTMVGNKAAKYNNKKGLNGEKEDKTQLPEGQTSEGEGGTGNSNNRIPSNRRLVSGGNSGANGTLSDLGLGSAIQQLTNAVNQQNNILNAQEFEKKSEKRAEGGKEFVSGIAETVAALHGAVAGATISAGFNKNAVSGAITGAGVADKAAETVINVAAEVPGTVVDTAKATAAIGQDITGVVKKVFGKDGGNSSDKKEKNGKNVVGNVTNNITQTTNVNNTIQNSGGSVDTDKLTEKMKEDISDVVTKQIEELKKDSSNYTKSNSNNKSDDAKDIGKQISDTMKKNSKNDRLNNNKRTMNVDDL